MYRKLAFVLLIITVLLPEGDSYDIYENCGESIKCVENNLVKMVDDFDSKSSVSLMGDYLLLEKTNEETFLPKSEEGIFERVLRYMNNHELRIRFPSQRNARSLMEEARKKKGILKKLILPILLLLKLKALIVIPAVLFSIALIAFKGLGAGFMALLISGAVGLKSLLEKHGSSSSFSYEVIPQLAGPHWNRNGVIGTEGWTGLVPGYQTIPK